MDSHDDDEVSHPFTEQTTIPNGEILYISNIASGHGDALITSPNNSSPTYKVTSHISIDRSKPKIVLSSDNRAISHLFHHWRTGYKIGVDHRGHGESQMEWVELKRGGFTALNKSYSFLWNGKMYVIARMKGSEVAGGSRLLRHYKVVEKDGGEVVATYVSGEASGARRGTITVQRGLDANLRLVVVTALAEWREMARRQQRTAGGVVA